MSMFSFINAGSLCINVKHYEAPTTLNQFANFVFAMRNVMLLNPSIRGSVHFTFTVNIFMGVIICAKVQIKQQGRCHTVHT